MLIMTDGEKTMRLEDFDMRPLRNHSRPRSGSINHRSKHIDGHNGDWYFGSEIGSKTYSLQANILEPDWKKLEKRLDELTAFLFDSKGKPKIIKVQWENTKKFAYVRLADSIVPDVASILEKVPINFVNYEGAEFSESNTFDLEEPLKYDTGHSYGVMSYPNTEFFDWIYTRQYSGIENYASLDSPIKMTIAGTVKNGAVTHLKTNQKISFPDISNGTVIIDSETFNIQVNGVDTIFDGNFFDMVPGNNGFLFEASTVKATVKFDWLHKFM